MRVDGKVALVAGAGSGIGRQSCVKLGREDARIVAVDRNQQTAEETTAMVDVAVRELAVTELLMAFLDTEQKKQQRLVPIPMGRSGEAAEIADAVVFLASVTAAHVTPQ